MSSSPGRLVLCPDVTPGRGLGHLQRSLALAEAWQRAGGEAVLVAPEAPLDSGADSLHGPEEISGRRSDPDRSEISGRPDSGSGADLVQGADQISGRTLGQGSDRDREPDRSEVSGGFRDAVVERARSAGIEILDSVPVGADWIVLDGYEVGAEDQAWARAHARRVGLIDDHGTMGHHEADLVIDQNLGATADPYGAEAGRVLLGPRFALLRESFSAHSPFWGAPVAPEREQDTPERSESTPLELLVTLGGSPSEVAVEFVAETLALLDLPADAVATVGPLGAPTTKRGELVPSLGHPNDLAETLAGTRVALSAAGSTAWELCATGTPAVLVAVADNQEPVGEALAEAGAVDHLGPVAEADPQQAAAAVDALLSGDDLWNERHDTGHRLVDGRGADRVVTAMRAIHVELRSATTGDAKTLWEWANDPTVRASAFDPTPIEWDDHVAWLEARLAEPDTTILVAVDGGEPWGQVRLDAIEGEPGAGEVDVSVAAERRGEGLAGPLLDAALTRAFAERPDLHRVVARVKAENAASLRAFDRAAFVRVDVDRSEDDDDVITLHRDRSDG